MENIQEILDALETNTVTDFSATDPNEEFKVIYDALQKIHLSQSAKGIEQMYLDYVNNFLTVGAFADHYSSKLGIQLDDIEANNIIDLGRKLNLAKERKV